MNIQMWRAYVVIASSVGIIGAILSNNKIAAAFSGASLAMVLIEMRHSGRSK